MAETTCTPWEPHWGYTYLCTRFIEQGKSAMPLDQCHLDFRILTQRGGEAYFVALSVRAVRGRRQALLALDHLGLSLGQIKQLDLSTTGGQLMKKS